MSAALRCQAPLRQLRLSPSCRDELPLYLFDKQCLGWKGETSQHSLADDYEVLQFHVCQNS